MQKRLITGIFIAAAFVGIVLLALCVSYIAFDVFVLLLMFLAAYEMSKALSVKGNRPFLPVIFAGIPAAYAAFFVTKHFTANISYGMLAFTGVIAVCALIALALKYAGKSGFFETSAVLVYPIMVLLFMLLINHIMVERVRAAAMILLFLAAPFTDVFAYLVGSTLKGPKLCPSISPKKTISGACGGLFGGILGGLLVYLMTITSAFGFLGLAPLGTKIDILHFMILGLLASIFTQGGDLAASYVKRKAGVKDYGKLLPGHGGIMDRIDGIMFSAMLIYLYVTVVV